MRKIIILFLAGCIIMIVSILVVVSRSKSKAGHNTALPAMPKALELLHPQEPKQMQAEEQPVVSAVEPPVVEEDPPLPPGEPLLN